VELYDHVTEAKETENIANQFPEIVSSLKQIMAAKFK
jgi:hypothetical protein